MRKPVITTIITALMMTIAAQAQQLKEPNLKFGAPTEEELTMTTYEHDEEAAALVLCDITDVSYETLNGSFKVFYNIKRRVKVLKPEGTKEANVSVEYVSKDDVSMMKEIVTGVKATAYNMENGKVVKTKMTSDMMFNERVDNSYRRLKFTVPQVRQGTVFEYQYRIESDYYYDLNTWYAQKGIPVAYTRYELVIPEYFQFHIDQTGAQSLEAKTEPVSVSLMGFGGISQCNGTAHKFVGRHLPALKGDDYVWSVTDYCTKVRCELNRIVITGVYYKDFTSSWESIDKMLMDMDDFGGCLKSRNPLRKEMGETATDGDVKEKIQEAVKLLRKHVRWNGEYSLTGSPAGGVLKKGTGTSGDMNFILISMLKDMGMEVYPVVLRTRDRGHLPLSHPSVKMLNAVVAGVVVNDSTVWYVDAAVAGGDVNTLTPKLVVDRARLLTANGGIWVNLQDVSKGMITAGIKCSLSADGSFSGRYDAVMRGNSAMSARADIQEAKDSADYVSSCADRLGVTIEKHGAVGKSGFSSEMKEYFVFSGQCDVSGDVIYVNPLVLSPVRENIFTAEKRDMPVEFSYSRSIRQSVTLELPHGYHVDELPAPLNLRTPDGGMSCQMQMAVTDNLVTTMFRMTIAKPVFTVGEYEAMKQLFELMAEKANGIIAIKKN